MPKKYLHAHFEISDDTAKKINQWLLEVETHDNIKELRQTLAGLIADLTTEGLSYFFLQSLDKIGMGNIIKNMVRLGLKPVMQTVKTISKKATAGMSQEQLAKTADFFREFLNIKEQV